MSGPTSDPSRDPSSPAPTSAKPTAAGAAAPSHAGPSLVRRAFERTAPLLALAAVIAFFSVATMVKGWNDLQASAVRRKAPAPAMSVETVQELWRKNRFFTPENFQLVWKNTAIVAIAALGMTLIIISGGIDLSVGHASALASVVLAVGLGQGVGAFANWWLGLVGMGSATPPALPTEINAALAVMLCLLTGVAAGFVNGGLATSLKVVPFIITLGTMTIYLGLAKRLTGESVYHPARDKVPDFVSGLMRVPDDAGWFTLPWSVWLLAGLAALTAFVLHQTVFGRHVYAIGSNEATARLCGVPVDRVKWLVYSFAGFFTAVAGLLNFAQIKVGDPNSGSGMELKVIAAVVIGGGSLSGGRGSVVGTLVGAAIMSVINSGGTHLGLQDSMQNIILGVIIVSAVTLDQWRQKKLAA
ncbi:MAG TPA: ABC transporter permease [Pirellulales bacterium]